MHPPEQLAQEQANTGRTHWKHRKPLSRARDFTNLRTFIDVMQVDPSTEHRVFYGGGKYVVSLGPLGDTYVVKGKEFALGSSWLATLVYEGGKWQLISFSSSTNAFDNPIYEAKMEAHGLTYGGCGLIVGFLISFIGGMIWRRRKAKEG